MTGKPPERFMGMPVVLDARVPKGKVIVVSPAEAARVLNSLRLCPGGVPPRERKQF